MKAVQNNTFIAECDKIITIEKTIIFPTDSIEYFKESNAHATSHGKGEASYYTMHFDGKENKNVAWHYPEVSELDRPIKVKSVFWRGVVIEK